MKESYISAGVILNCVLIESYKRKHTALTRIASFHRTPLVFSPSLLPSSLTLLSLCLSLCSYVHSTAVSSEMGKRGIMNKPITAKATVIIVWKGVDCNG